MVRPIGVVEDFGGGVVGGEVVCEGWWYVEDFLEGDDVVGVEVGDNVGSGVLLLDVVGKEVYVGWQCWVWSCFRGVGAG